MPAKRALITGISGQDGSYLAELLLSKGYAVHGLYRSGSNSPAEIRGHVGDVQDPDAITRCVQAARPEECYHLAAQTFVGREKPGDLETLQTNVHGTWHLLSAVNQWAPDCRVFLAGSSEMFGAVSEVPQREDTPFRPQSTYGISKLTAYHLMRQYRELQGMYACCGILYNHESPRRPPHFVSRKITQAAAAIQAGTQNEVKLGNLEDVRDWGRAQDYVRAMWLMLQQDKPEDYILATGILHSVREFLQEAFAYVGRRWEEHVVIDPTLYRPARSVPLVGDASKARSQLGWKLEYDFSSLVREMIDHDLQARRNL